MVALAVLIGVQSPVLAQSTATPSSTQAASSANSGQWLDRENRKAG